MGRIVDMSEVLLEAGLSSSVTEEERAMAAMAITRAEGAVRRLLRYDPAQDERTEYYPRASANYASRQAVWDVDDTHAFLKRVNETATCELQLQHLPIRSIATLYVDYDGRFGKASGAFGTSTLKTEGTDFWASYDVVDDDGAGMCRDGILRAMGTWPIEPGTVKVTYTAGWSASELRGQENIVNAVPIWEVVLEEAVRRTRKALVQKKNTLAGVVAGLITSESLGDYSYSVDSGVAKELFGSTNDLMPSSTQKLQEFINYGWEA